MRPLELRCSCRRAPLLAVCGRDASGGLFVHVKVFKQGRVFGEIVAEGPVRLRCRECNRWNRVDIKSPTAQLIDEPLPESIQL